jgi:hypothetical protein
VIHLLSGSFMTRRGACSEFGGQNAGSRLGDVTKCRGETGMAEGNVRWPPAFRMKALYEKGTGL